MPRSFIENSLLLASRELADRKFTYYAKIMQIAAKKIKDLRKQNAELKEKLAKREAAEALLQPAFISSAAEVLKRLETIPGGYVIHENDRSLKLCADEPVDPKAKTLSPTASANIARSFRNEA